MRLGILSTILQQILGDISFHSVSIRCSRLKMLVGSVSYFASCCLKCCHKCSMGFRSGDCAGHSKVRILWFISHSIALLEVCLGSFVKLGLDWEVEWYGWSGKSRSGSKLYYFSENVNQTEGEKLGWTPPVYVRANTHGSSRDGFTIIPKQTTQQLLFSIHTRSNPNWEIILASTLFLPQPSIILHVVPWPSILLLLLILLLLYNWIFYIIFNYSMAWQLRSPLPPLTQQPLEIVHPSGPKAWQLKRSL